MSDEGNGYDGVGVPTSFRRRLAIVGEWMILLLVWLALVIVVSIFLNDVYDLFGVQP